MIVEGSTQVTISILRSELWKNVVVSSVNVQMMNSLVVMEFLLPLMKKAMREYFGQRCSSSCLCSDELFIPFSWTQAIDKKTTKSIIFLWGLCGDNSVCEANRINRTSKKLFVSSITSIRQIASTTTGNLLEMVGLHVNHMWWKICVKNVKSRR